MRGLDLKQNELCSYTTLEQRIPTDHPLRPLRALVDSALASMDQDFDGLYSTLGRARQLQFDHSAFRIARIQALNCS